jgi:hypothetical protein
MRHASAAELAPSVADIGTVQNPAANCKEILNKTCDEKAETGDLRLLFDALLGTGLKLNTRSPPLRFRAQVGTS